MQVCGFAIRECSQRRPCHASALRPGIDFSTRIICVCWRALLWETRADNDKFGIVEAIVVSLLTTISGFRFLGFAMVIWSFFCSRHKLISERKCEASHAEACWFNRTFLLNFKAWVYGHRRCAADLFQKMLRSATRNQPKRHAGKTRWAAQVFPRLRPYLRLRLLFFRIYLDWNAKLLSFILIATTRNLPKRDAWILTTKFFGRNLSVV